MAGSVNKVIIMGRLGRDPEIRTMRNGSRVANFSIATSESWRDKSSGERKEKTEWHNITVWPENTVNIVEKYVRKGDLILVEGQLETRKWQDQSGGDRYSTDVVIKGFQGSVTLIGRTENSGRANDGGGGRSNDREREVDDRPSGNGGRSGGGVRDELDDEIPF